MTACAENQKRAEEVLAAVKLAHKTAVTLGLLPRGSHHNCIKLRVSHSARCKAGLNKSGMVLYLSTADRYFDSKAYFTKLSNSGIGFKKVWAQAMKQFKETGVARFVEYAHVDSEPNIGGFSITDEKIGLLAVVCHEFAHCLAHREAAFTRSRIKPHGVEWQAIYKQLRDVLVNPFIETVTLEPLALAVLNTPAKKARSSTKTASVITGTTRASFAAGSVRSLVYAQAKHGITKAEWIANCGGAGFIDKQIKSAMNKLVSGKKVVTFG